jgi:hypothetical protein
MNSGGCKNTASVGNRLAAHRLRAAVSKSKSLNALRQNLRHVAVRVQNGDDLQRLRFRAVDNQVRIYGEKPDLGGGQVGPPVSPLRKVREISELAADDGFHTVGGLLAAFLLDVPPDLYEIADCLWR